MNVASKSSVKGIVSAKAMKTRRRRLAPMSAGSGGRSWHCLVVPSGGISCHVHASRVGSVPERTAQRSAKAVFFASQFRCSRLPSQKPAG